MPHLCLAMDTCDCRFEDGHLTRCPLHEVLNKYVWLGASNPIHKTLEEFSLCKTSALDYRTSELSEQSSRKLTNTLLKEARVN